jgi:hypothetical protein
MNIDIGSVFSSDQKFINYAFGLSCGFGANVVRYANKLSKLGSSRIRTAIEKGASKGSRKLAITMLRTQTPTKHSACLPFSICLCNRPIEVEIKYIPSTTTHPCDRVRCLRGSVWRLCLFIFACLFSNEIFFLGAQFAITM